MRIVVNDLDWWDAPTWIVQNVVAHICIWLQPAEAQEISALFNIHDLVPTRVDLREIPQEQLVKIAAAARIAFRCSLGATPRDWHNPESYGEFIEHFKRLICTLENDSRVANRTNMPSSRDMMEELKRSIDLDRRWQQTGEPPG